MSMNKVKREKINQAIDHWFRLLIKMEKIPPDSFTRDELYVALRAIGDGEAYGEDDCPLCKKYRRGNEEDSYDGCELCPICERTKLGSCNGTPYTRFSDPGKKEDRLRYAREEIKFLKSLLDEGE